MQKFNGTTRSTGGTRASNPKDLHVDEIRMWPNLRFGHMSDCKAVSHISNVARRPVSALWTLNYTTNSTTEAMNSGNIANVKFAINQNISRPWREINHAPSKGASFSLCEFSFRYYWKVRALDGGGEQ